MPSLSLNYYRHKRYEQIAAMRGGSPHMAMRVPTNPVGEVKNYVVTTIDNLRAMRLACGTLTKEPAALAVVPRLVESGTL